MKIRTTLIATLTISLFFFFLAIYLTKDVSTPWDKLRSATAIIKEFRVGYRRVKFKTEPQLDILLDNNSFFIRLSDGFNKKYWSEIQKEINIGKRIDMRFIPHLLKENTLHNPTQLSIDNLIIIPFKKNISNATYVMYGFYTGAILFGLWFTYTLRNYRKYLIKEHKKH